MASSIFSLICILSTYGVIEACISYTIVPSSSNNDNSNNNGVDMENNQNVSEPIDNNPLSSIVNGGECV